jgi:hypothetical protein
VASVLLALVGSVGLVLFAQAYLWGARIAIERHGDLWVAAGLVSLAAVNGIALGLAVYRSALVRGLSNRPLCWTVVLAWPINFALIVAIYGVPL